MLLSTDEAISVMRLYSRHTISWMGLCSMSIDSAVQILEVRVRQLIANQPSIFILPFLHTPSLIAPKPEPQWLNTLSDL